MRNSSTLIIGTVVAVGITVVAVTAVAQSPVEPTQIVAQQTLTNRSESPFSEIDFRLGKEKPRGEAGPEVIGPCGWREIRPRLQTCPPLCRAAI